MKPRRIVVGQAQGRAQVVSDEFVEPIVAKALPGYEFVPVWGSDAPSTVPNDGGPPQRTGWFPPLGGYRIGIVVFPPESAPDEDAAQPTEADFAEVAERIPGLLESLDPENPVMHRTQTVDVNYVLSGEIWLELDGGEMVHVRQGDCVVQNGLKHGWHNRSDQPCVMAVTLVGAALR
jgi:mannose-6-phosphate isomerase-like protein (cupin superfamily)